MKLRPVPVLRNVTAVVVPAVPIRAVGAIEIAVDPRSIVVPWTAPLIVSAPAVTLTAPLLVSEARVRGAVPSKVIDRPVAVTRSADDRLVTCSRPEDDRLVV